MYVVGNEFIITMFATVLLI